MALAETAKLAIDLSLTGNARTGLAGVQKQLAGLDRQTGQIGRGFKTLGAGIGVAFRNAAFIGIAALGGLTALIAKSVKEGQEAAKVQTIYANAIANSGKVSTQYVGILNKQQTALMNLAGVDDELIKTEQTRLIQMGLTGDQVAKITPLILDFSKATGIDLLTATKLAGKAVNGNTGALARYGIQIDKAKAKTDPFAATVDALNGKFGGTTKALSGSLEARLGAFRENMANIREELGIKLLPALTRIVDVAGKDLVPAFGKFIDRIMPSLISGLDTFTSMLENGGAERGIKAITDALGPMVELLKIAAAPVKAIVSAFLSLPPQVQGILVGAFAVNKLSGGLIAKGVGEIAGGLLQRGGTPANPLFVMDVSGGLGKIGGVAAGAAAGTGLALATAVIAPLAVGAAALIIQNRVNEQGDALVVQATSFASKATNQELAKSIEGLREQVAKVGLNPFNEKGKIVDTLNVLIAEQNRRATGGALPDGTGLMGTIGGAVAKLFQALAKAPAVVSAEKSLARRGVTERAAAAGFHPSEAAIQRTLDKNAKHAEVIQARIAASTKATADRMLALPGAISAALRGIILTNPTTVNSSTGFTVPLRKPKVVNSSTGFSLPARAGGGPVRAWQDYRVGEEGPEILRMGSRSGMVIPNRASGSPIVNARVAVSTRDVNTGQTVKSRYGPTYTQAGAG